MLMYTGFPVPIRPGVITERPRVLRLLLGNISAIPAKVVLSAPHGIG
jgi:hypothetical protein